jgi:hypothetical protein
MNNDEKNCPYCGETIKAVAIKCKHCQSDLSAPAAKETVETKSNNEDINCRYCGEVNVGTAITCKKCKLQLNNTLITDAPIKYSFKETFINDFKKNGKKVSLLLLFVGALLSLRYFDVVPNIYSYYFDTQTINSKQTITDIKSNPNLKNGSNGNISTPKLTTVKYSCADGVFNFVISNEKVTMDFVSDYFKFFDVEIGHRGQDIFVYKSTINNEGLTYDPTLEIISLIKFNGSNVVDSTIVKDCVIN